MIPALLLAMALLWLPLTGMASSVLGDAGNAPSPSDPEVSDSKPSGTTVP
ncbi:MAG: hypothetical protein G3I08_03785 [Ferrovum sp.]|nr:hypothetical protein [Ferrovum sp.]